MEVLQDNPFFKNRVGAKPGAVFYLGLIFLKSGLVTKFGLTVLPLPLKSIKQIAC